MLVVCEDHMTELHTLSREPETATGITVLKIRAQLAERGVPATPLNVIAFATDTGADEDTIDRVIADLCVAPDGAVLRGRSPPSPFEEDRHQDQDKSNGESAYAAGALLHTACRVLGV
jgi:hypothetical protein